MNTPETAYPPAVPSPVGRNLSDMEVEMPCLLPARLFYLILLRQERKKTHQIRPFSIWYVSPLPPRHIFISSGRWLHSEGLKICWDAQLLDGGTQQNTNKWKKNLKRAGQWVLFRVCCISDNWRNQRCQGQGWLLCQHTSASQWRACLLSESLGVTVEFWVR